MYQGNWKIYTQPAVEPVTLQQAKQHLNLDAGTLDDNLDVQQTITPASHAIAAAYSLEGAAIDLSAAGEVMIELAAGACGAGGTVDVKVQDSEDNVDWDDVPGLAFTQVTAANDNANQQLAYENNRTYVRAVATVAGNACVFGVNVVMHAPVNDDDLTITRYIKTARRWVENYTGYALISQVWDLFLDRFPAGRIINVPRPPLVSVTSLQYKNSSNVLTTLGTSYYVVDTQAAPGRIQLTSGQCWPNIYPDINAVQIRYTAGYGAAASAVPPEYIDAILRKITDLYENRGDNNTTPDALASIRDLLDLERIVNI